MSTVLDVLDFVMLALFFSAITICLLIYKGSRSKTFLAFGAYFVIQVLLELEVRRTEVDNPLTRWIGQVFSLPGLIKGLTYGGLVFVMMLAALFILKKAPKPVHFVFPCVILVWLMLTCGLSLINLVIYSGYFIPCEIFYFGLALFVLKEMEKRPETDFHPALKITMKLIMIFSVIIVIEDVFFGVYYKYMLTDYNGFTLPDADIYVKERSFSENLLQIILALITICSGGRILAGAMRSHSSEAEENRAEGMDADSFATYLGLSPRERDVLPLLLTNMDMNQISEALIISYGTVKSHTHNIYRKAGVQNRLSLMKLAEEFKASPQQPKQKE